VGTPPVSPFAAAADDPAERCAGRLPPPAEYQRRGQPSHLGTEMIVDCLSNYDIV